ncbi:hypothetical protein PoMZ_09052 [Pyricularia oryzae]|uniref:aldehyde dehydrogenase (NAD(+)) n=1 Tax=Pyricularia oryzae TaxID=318829 RepID=A0A4P7N0U7_PYROR|nr:hypothetical protein PoMZ_09052 [Pyricularia oryzae]
MSHTEPGQKTADAHLLWVAGKEKIGGGDILPIENPATGEIFAHCHTASAQDVDQCIEQANDAFIAGTWSKAPRHFRADVLDQAATLLSEQLPELIDLEVLQTGRAVREMKAQVPSLVKWFRYYAARLRVDERHVLPTTGSLHNWVDRVPLGVCALITPFNHPLLIAVKKVAPALAAGNSVVLKPSELTPITSLQLGRILRDAGLPEGVFSVLPGLGVETGKQLVSHRLVRKVDVTGSTAAGRAIGAIAGGNLARFNAELGGKAPLVVFETSDLDAAVNGIVFGAFVASGQTCVAVTRVLVHKSILGALTEKLSEKCNSIVRRIGDPKNPLSMMGPLISSKQLSGVQRLVDAAVASGNARLLCGGQRMSGVSPLDGFDLSKGYFFPPTVLCGTNPDGSNVCATDLWYEEAFGPVVVVASFQDEGHAVRLANDTSFGLGAGIWTRDLSQAFRVSEQIEAGIVWVNTHHRNDPSSPWGAHGTRSDSGLGTENGAEAYMAYTAPKSVVINYASTETALREEDWFREDQSGGAVRYG